MRKVAKTMAEEPARARSSGAWARRSTPSATRSCARRCILQLALGNVGVSGGGANIFRGHDNVQGATDVGPNPDSLPGYYGLAEGSWKHFAAVWDVDFEWIKKQYAPGMMSKPGMTVSRWIDGVLEKNELIDQDPNLRGDVLLGPCAELADARPRDDGGDGQARPAGRGRSVSVGDRGDGGDAGAATRTRTRVYLLPAATQFETEGSVHRVEPLAPVAREGDRAAVRVAHRPHDHVPARAEARLRRAVHRQEGRQAEHQAGQGQGRHGRAGDRGHPARDQPRRLDHRLHRPDRPSG